MKPHPKSAPSGAIESLVAEHRRIEAILDALARYAERVEAGEPLPTGDLAELVAVLRGYADAHHHAKEEGVLFRAMVRAGLSEHDGPVAFMVEQHEEGRRLIEDLEELAEATSFTAQARARVGRVARDYVILLRAHIRDEDDVVYPLARARVRPAAWSELEAACAEIDAARRDALAEWIERSDQLIERYGTAAKPAPAARSESCWKR